MNVQVRHNGTNISGFVQAYERVHKICTGIGTLRVEVIRTINRNFDTWDNVDIYENGDFKCRYYISSVEDIVPQGIIVLECQDISKRLVDYFIPDSYNIDYPTSTRYWIQKFLTEAGVSVTFTTSSQGNLISNNTQLGLQPVYEQVLTLLQMSGWYMFFNESEEAIIGPLETDLSSSVASVGKNEILNINVISDDKMLRNRALILGTFDPYTMQYASADVTVHTRWNYDHSDVRAVVISNSNIPNVGTAYAMANQIIKEFARITVEKHITVANAKNWTLGYALRVTSNVWKGKGLITTFGTSMSKQGLVTNVILDERCPRLFGFFDFGDYVYVSTFGDGVWRKHIKFDPTWYDFSTGLTTESITDLHIKDGIFGSVGFSGQMYYTGSEDSSWGEVIVESLDSSEEAAVISGAAINYTTFSGIKARATIVDKMTGTIKYGVDNLPRLNNGDYFLDFFTSSGTVNTPTFSGIPDRRGWILECDPFTGNIVGGIGSGIYPISYSGNFDLAVVDIENDGINDYVSVATTLAGAVGEGFDYGRRVTSPQFHDQSNLVGASAGYDGNKLVDTLSKGNYIAFFNDETDNISEYVYRSSNSIVRTKITKTFNTTNQNFDLSTSTAATSSFLSGFTVCGATKQSTDTYRITYYSSSSESPSVHQKRTFFYRTWNATTNSLSGASTIGEAELDGSIYDDVVGRSGASMEGVIDGYYYVYFIFMSSSSFLARPPAVITDPFPVSNLLVVSQVKVGLDESSITQSTPFIWDFGYGTLMPGSGNDEGVFIGYFFGEDNPFAAMCQKTYLPHFVLPLAFRTWDGSASAINYFAVLKDTTPSLIEAQLEGDPNFVSDAAIDPKSVLQLTEHNYIVFVGNPDTATDHFYYNGLTASSGDDVVLGGDFYPIFGLGNERFIANKSGQWSWCNTSDMSTEELITPPAGYTSLIPFSNIGANAQLYWRGIQSSVSYILTTNFGGALSFIRTAAVGFSVADFVFIAGNFFASVDTLGTTHTVGAVMYLDGIYPATSTFTVLRRTGMEYDLIQTDSKPIRIDISNSTPVLSVQDVENTFVSNFVYGDTLTQIIPTELEAIPQVRDYRYTYMEIPYSGGAGITASGIPLQAAALYVTGSGVWGGDLNTYSGGFNLVYEIPSGTAERLETSNYGMNGQYLFVTTSGDLPMFYQKDPEAVTFASYPGLPASRATMIRLDDRM